MTITDPPHTILIVEDDPTMSHIADNRCRAHGYDTHCVASGEEALAWLAHHRPDMMLVDIQLPGIDGLACIERMKQLPTTADISVLVLSSSEESAVIERAFDLGVADFVQKPVNWQILLHHIARLLSYKQTQWESELLRNAANFGRDSILITDADCRIRYVNPAFTAITGYGADEVMGKNPRLLASGLHDKPFYREMWRRIKEEGGWQGTITDRHKDGALYQHRMQITALHKEGNPALPVSHYIAISHDVTAEVRRERQEREAEKMASITTMVGGVAHDFNNMLAGISGNCFLMRTKLHQPAALPPHIDAIESLGARGAELISRMLAFVQHDMVHLEAIALEEFIREELNRCPTPVHTHPFDRGLRIHGDKKHLRQMLDVLISNACDAIASKPDGEVELRLEQVDGSTVDDAELPDGRYARLTVSDNGCGMDRATKARVFEPFFTTKEVDQGNGLGLSMLYGSMQTHQGAVAVESTLGEGSRFTLYFPLVTTQPKEETMQTNNRRGGKIRVLLVDDEAVVREVSEEILLETGEFDVHTAANGRVALSLLEQHGDAIDLALLDVMMPDLNGIDLARQLRRRGHRFPIIFCTGYNRYEVLDQTAGLSNIAVVNKPFDYGELIASIKEKVETG